MKRTSTKHRRRLHLHDATGGNRYRYDPDLGELVKRATTRRRDVLARRRVRWYFRTLFGAYLSFNGYAAERRKK